MSISESVSLDKDADIRMQRYRMVHHSVRLLIDYWYHRYPYLSAPSVGDLCTERIYLHTVHS
jgi:hypothetical protein